MDTTWTFLTYLPPCARVCSNSSSKGSQREIAIGKLYRFLSCFCQPATREPLAGCNDNCIEYRACGLQKKIKSLKLDYRKVWKYQLKS